MEGELRKLESDETVSDETYELLKRKFRKSKAILVNSDVTKILPYIFKIEKKQISAFVEDQSILQSTAFIRKNQRVQL